MSNKIVPQVYRSIIDDVIANVKVDFEEYGMEDEVLVNLQAKWEAKLLQTRVADFARAPGSTMSPDGDDDDGRSAQLTHKTSLASSPPGPSGLQGHGLALPGRVGTNGLYGNGSGNGGGDVRVKLEPGDDPMRLRGGASQDVKPNIYASSSSSSHPYSYDPSEAERKPEPNAAGLLPGDEVIDSDLDDSDDELRDEGEAGDDEGEVDIVFCVYDKVQRVKNKWKTVFKDGMIHINGRDYLFAKCNGEFEW